MTTHTITISFTTDRPISELEKDTLVHMIALQVEEPVVYNDEDTSLEWLDDATYTTSDVAISHSQS